MTALIQQWVGCADHYTYRLKVPEGWLVRTCESSATGGWQVSMAFVPDPKHTWEKWKEE